MKDEKLLFKFQVRLRTTAGGYEYFYFYADTNIEKFLNKNNIQYTRNMIQPYVLSCDAEEKKIPEKLKELGKITYDLGFIDYKNIETLKEWLNKDFQKIYDTLDLLIKNQNQLIDYLKSKGE